MLELAFGKSKNSRLHALFLGAHSDDIEIGCGGTVLTLIEEYANLAVTWIVFGAQGERADEAHQSAEAFLRGVREKQVCVKGFRDGFFPYNRGEAIKEYFEELKRDLSPDIIFTHFRHDLHQDHRLICELTWNTFRDHLILEYEVPKYDGDLGNPNVFMPLDQEVARTKIRYIIDHFQTQQDRHWFTEDTFSAIMRLRGVESAGREKYAEAFYGRKIVLWSNRSAAASRQG